jgi:hemerythrin
MSKIKKIKIISGVYWVEVKEANLFILCGCPADTVKHLKKRGLIEEIEKDGISFETGPNVILLSDVLMQNGSFSNLTEFPVLQMLYLQGMLIPNHPNNTGTAPMLIGTEEQVKAQMEYIYRGNYGLVSVDEMMEAGASWEEAQEMMKIKLRFAFGKITPSHELIDKRIVKNENVEIRNGVLIKRIAFNQYEVSYKDENVQVDLNLQAGELYDPPYQLGYHFIKREYFAIIHSGEGDGWDLYRPCMASVIIFQGKIYLIDAGPNILASLNYLGISVNEIEGIFHTHAHDDHFAGLTTLIRTDRRFKYYATPLVRKAVTKKLCALMSMQEESFGSFFDINDLPFDEWTNVEGLEVKPVYSPHPVETNVFFFRANWIDGYKVYAHLADVTSDEVLQKMIVQDAKEVGITEERFEQIKAKYLYPAHLKKIDIGGGMIHGKAEDFREDKSHKIVLAHTSKPLTMKQREIGSSSAFGMVDVLIPTNHDYLIDFAHKHLKNYFPFASESELSYLLNHPILSYNAGSLLLKKGQESKYVYLLLTGSVEFLHARTGKHDTLPAGSFIGFYAGYLGLHSPETYWASCNVHVLQMPSSSYHEFVARNNLYSELKRMEDYILFLQSTWLFGDVVSFPNLANIAKQMKRIQLTHNYQIPLFQSEKYLNNPFSANGSADEDMLHLIAHGEVSIKIFDREVEKLEKSDFLGGDKTLLGNHRKFELKNVKAVLPKDTTLFAIPATAVMDIPIVHWKLLETYNKRIRAIYNEI